MMSNSSSTAFANGLQQHNLTTTIDYLNQNGSTSFPNVAASDNGLILEKPPTTGPYYAPVPNPTTYYSTQLVAPAPGTILITNNFGPDDASTISGVSNSFNNSSIRIVTHSNNNNNNNNNIDKTPSMEEDKQLYHQLHHLHHQPQPAAALTQHPSSTSQTINPVKMPNSLVTTPAPGTTTTTSTVVLDRINICINNHYGDTSTMSQQSPIIPPVIQHTTIVDTAAPCTPPLQSTEPCTTPIISSISQDRHVEEPDSTTTTNCNNELMQMEQDQPSSLEHESEKDTSYESVVIEQKYEIGEDVFVKRRDGRFYLGTVVNIHRQQYLVQFDDKTDYWSNIDELFKLSKVEKPTCLGCRQENDSDMIETCERCGRSYHQRCTDEVLPKTGEWMCKRCLKPMKYSYIEEAEDKMMLKQKAPRDFKKIIQFPYDLGSLTWDEKHRVNLEQIYCYCGKSGQFDNNMIQCCKCKQWFHAHCVECVKTLFRGDVFFIFGCSVCNNGREFLRRIEMSWIDLTHLILYNMAIMKNFQKYHHLHKDIYPFALDKRSAFQLPASMLSLTDNEFKAGLLKTLQTHPKLFQCGKEIKKDHAFWGLRSNKPPQGLFYDIKPHEVLSNQLIKDKLKINILPHDEEEDDDEDNEYEDEDDGSQQSVKDEQPLAKKAKLDMKSDDDDKFTSDDEIPIKQILEKAKSSNLNLDHRELKADDSDNSNELPMVDDKKEKTQKKEDSITAATTTTVSKLISQKSSRKRKAFTLSKGYRDSDKSNDLPRSICDSSSDENSSSSRGTLDLIIPPPKDFLGVNNPFRMLTPKKSDNASTYKMSGGSCITKKTVSFGGSILDLNSKIAALKSTGLFPNISNNDIAKAAGQPRLVRTIKRRLSAKDIVIGPNQEVRRRRTRPLSSNIEVISTTTINPIVSAAFFPIRASIPESTNPTSNSKNTSTSVTSSSQSNSPHITSSTSSSLDCAVGVPVSTITTTHGRRLRKRPEKSSPQNSRRNSISSSSSSNSCPAQLTLPPPTQPPNTVPLTDLKQSVNKYFGAVNRIENGEKFVIRAKRRLTNGQLQYLIEWES